MSTQQSSDGPFLGRAPTAEEEALFAWGEETVRGSLAALVETARHLVTLDTALAGGGIVFFDEKVAPPAFRPLAVACFLVSLALAFWTTIPAAAKVDPRKPYRLKQARDSALRCKSHQLTAACTALLAGLVVGLLGLLWKLAWGT